VKRATARYNIPRSTLRDHLKGRRGKVTGSSRGGAGRGTALSADVENLLAKSISTLAKNGFGLTKTEVQDLVAEYLKKTGIQSRFKNNRPGNDWWLAFKSRYKLSIKKPEGLEHSRKSQLSDPFVIYEFYDRLEKAIEDANLNNKPHQIFNCDETSFCHD
jgi:hypothetical protein